MGRVLVTSDTYSYNGHMSIIFDVLDLNSRIFDVLDLDIEIYEG